MRRNILLLMTICVLIACGCVQKKEEKDIIRIRYANWELASTQLKLMRQIIDEFHEHHPHIRVKLEWGQTQHKIIVEAAGGVCPDVFYWGDITPLLGKNMLEDLSPYIEKYKEVAEKVRNSG